MKSILSTVTSVSELYESFPGGGETGWFVFVRGEQKFYEWKDTWSEVVFTDMLVVTSWRQDIENGEYNVTNNANDTPTGLTGAIKLIVFTDYSGKQVKVVQSGDKAYYLESGEINLLWKASPLTPLQRRGEQEKKCEHHHHQTGMTDFRYLQDPVETIDDLPLKFPQGGEFGFFAFVKDKKTFAYWDVEMGAWKYMNGGIDIPKASESILIVTESSENIGIQIPAGTWIKDINIFVESGNPTISIPAINTGDMNGQNLYPNTSNLYFPTEDNLQINISGGNIKILITKYNI